MLCDEPDRGLIRNIIRNTQQSAAKLRPMFAMFSVTHGQMSPRGHHITLHHITSHISPRYTDVTRITDTTHHISHVVITHHITHNISHVVITSHISHYTDVTQIATHCTLPSLSPSLQIIQYSSAGLGGGPLGCSIVKRKTQ